jgi:dolichol-phosphate mannosyltransferase
MSLVRTTLSIIVPIYNEEQTLPDLHARLTELVPQLGFNATEVLFIDDGSTDRSEQLIWEFVSHDPMYKGVFLTRNFGHQAALSTGLAHCIGDVVAVIDGDLQDPPEAIELLLRHIEGGADVAYGVRQARKENVFKRAAYAVFYRLLRRVSSIEIPLDSGDFCVMKRAVVDAMLRLPERNRFVRGIRSWVGYRQVGVPYERAARHAGVPKYTLRKLFHLAYDGLFSFTALPVRLMQIFGFVTSGLSFVIAIGYLLLALFHKSSDWPTGWASLIVSIWFLAGLQLLFMGLVGEYVHRAFDETRQRPIALIRQIAINPRTVQTLQQRNGESCNSSTLNPTPTSIASTGGGDRGSAS